MAKIIAILLAAGLAIIIGLALLGFILTSLGKFFDFILSPYTNWKRNQDRLAADANREQIRQLDHQAKLDQRINECIKRYECLGFFISTDQRNLKEIIQNMSNKDWQSLLDDLQLREIEVSKQSFSIKEDISKIRKSIDTQLDLEVESSRQKILAPDFTKEVYRHNAFSGDTNSVEFYNSFLSKIIKTDLPIDIKKLIALVNSPPSAPNISSNFTRPKFEIEFLPIEPDKREKRFYNGNDFDQAEFEKQKETWLQINESRNKAIDEYKKKYHEYKLELETNRSLQEMYDSTKIAYQNLLDLYGSHTKRIENYEKLSSDSFIAVFDLEYSKLNLPSYFPNKWEANIDSENRILVLDFWLPIKASLEFVKDRKQLKTRNELKTVKASSKDQDSIYDNFLYQISLGIVHFAFRSDTLKLIHAIGFNGIIEAPDDSTGKLSTNCVLSFLANRDEFMNFELEKVVPKECFKKLKGVSSSTLSKMTAVRPILQFNKKDKRFVEASEVMSSVEGVNIAAIHWAEFEALVRDIFSKEFSNDGAEVKITRASKDGGVDAVVFDPDPIKGGKFIIQAKRYTNVVGVSAVRDLYGTVMNEGANRGILVTTATYGPDAYDFVKDKPLTLINGSELLHLLQKHGHTARIDLKEAKAIAKASEEAS